MAAIGSSKTPSVSITSTTGDTIISEWTHVILFYKYHLISTDEKITTYCDCLKELCQTLSLTGRILVAPEGINGTLAGSLELVKAFTDALCGKAYINISGERDTAGDAICKYLSDSHAFFQRMHKLDLCMDSSEFKWSKTLQVDPLFPDLHIKLVKELIGSGGVLSIIPIEETAKGYLTPDEWHNELNLINPSTDDTVIIDCRNTKEFAIGRFPNAIDPMTTTFSQFPKWVKDNRHLLTDKKVLMYCTGGIRCEKASAFIRREVSEVKDVKHLKGGIHKYLETYGISGLWKGKNYVFDGRGSVDAEETRLGVSTAPKSSTTHSISSVIVGQCTSCAVPYEDFDPRCVCTVCREPTLTCCDCQSKLVEFHCQAHSHLRYCYFTNIDRFTSNELREQLRCLNEALTAFAIGRRFKKKRNTIQKQIEKVETRLKCIKDNDVQPLLQQYPTCSNGNECDCSGRCLGVCLNQKTANDFRQENSNVNEHPNQDDLMKLARESIQLQVFSKNRRRERYIQDIAFLQLSQPPSAHRDCATGIRIPPHCTRLLRCASKGKWCGKLVLDVLKQEFVDLSRPATLRDILKGGLLQLNDSPLTLSASITARFKASDVVSRIVHWHEAPVIVPPYIDVQKVKLPSLVIKEYALKDDVVLYVCNKPSTVPVHPAGPYLSNSLTMMVEAQETLESQSLIPIHRTDRVTSGLTICCTDSNVSRLFHKCFTEGFVKKCYLAKVMGKFFLTKSDLQAMPERDIGSYCWLNESESIEVNVPIETVDPANGRRAATNNGKPSRSIFRCLQYNEENETSLVYCYPITGRNHQLRIHLQWLGFPILGDIMYGGPPLLPSNNTIELLENAWSKQENDFRVPEPTENCCDAARLACACCRDGSSGIEKSFTDAQLLKSGHAIHLHALRYEVSFPCKKKSKDLSKKILDVLVLKVSAPDWVNITSI